LHLRIPACLMAASWVAIQMLTLTSHQRNVDPVSSTHIIRRALVLEAQLKHIATCRYSH
jgi:hypothetical protein